MGTLLQASSATSPTLRQDFRTGQPISCLLRRGSQRTQIHSAIVVTSAGFGLRAVLRGSLVEEREVKDGRVGVQRLRKIDVQGGRERVVSFGAGGFGGETSEGTAAKEEEKEEGEHEVKDAPLIGSMADILNLEKQFAFYGAYHSNKLNILIHMLFVWPIFFTNSMLWAYTPGVVPLPFPAGTFPLQQYMILNANFFIVVIYALYYAALDKKAGSLGAAICLGCWIGSQAIAQAWPWSTAWKFVLIAQVTCWTFQFIGHGVFEGRAPALLDNLPQAFLMAPFFVLLEFLQSFFGYEPYAGFRKAVEKKTEENIALWRSGKVAPSDSSPLLQDEA